MDIDQHTDEPVRFTVGGRDYLFSELTLAGLGKLQAWIREHVPHPFAVIKPHLAGFSAEDRAALLEGARKDASRWPPQVGTGEGAAVLLGSEAGQVETLLVAMQAHRPEADEADARRLYKALRRETAAASARGEEKPDEVVSRIYATIFGMDFDPAAGPDEARTNGDGRPHPKG